ncbi:Protein roadkill [Papilio machaon]|uniref:Protein roadkill n=1 Tax=Papilio machaon TaxID=76193 RepID=A0A0N1IIL1_PAPMA|nr:Protein roadkill [Papilio machaon]
MEDDGSVVTGNNDNCCQTVNAKWLCLEDIYQKFHRPNFYDIGCTYIADVPDHRFTYMTSQVGNIFLLQLFVSSPQEGSINVTVSNSNEMTFDKKTGTVYLDKSMKNFRVLRVGEREASTGFVTTYSFSDLDVECLKDKTLYIAITFKNSQSTEINSSTMDFSDLLNDPVGADFTIESLDGEKFSVHKLLLAGQSEVFKAMLKEETAESQNSYVKLVDIGKEDLQCILEFIYSGTVKDLESKNCYNLLMLADRFNLNGLKEITQHALCYQLTHDSALEILVLSDMYNANYLKREALKFIKKYNSILDSSFFDEIKNVDLVRELCRFLAA